jgi:alpha-tubulin suppressor-like RCC1 family protein
MKRSFSNFGCLGCVLFALGGSLSLGCGAPSEASEGDEADFGQISLALSQVPSGVACISVDVIGSTTVTKTFNVTAGATPVTLNLDRLPMGNVIVKANAYSATCGAGTPVWIADELGVTLQPGVQSTVEITFRKNNPVTGNVNFTGNIEGLAVTNHGSAVLVDGQVYFWGYDGGATHSTPWAVPGLSNVKKIAGGGYAVLAIKQDGTLWGFGNWHSILGAAGSGTGTGTQLSTGPYSFVDVGDQDACVGLDNSATYCWGRNANGQLGFGNTTTYNLPPTQSASNSMISIALGGSHACRIAPWGSTTCAGSNSVGQLGMSSATGSRTTYGSAVGAPASAMQLAAGNNHTLIVDAAGRVFATGQNSYGQLGIGNTSNQFGFVQVAGLAAVQAVAAGSGHSLALTQTGALYAWGEGSTGVLGTGTATGATTPQLVPFPPAKFIAAGFYHSCAVTLDQELYCWGNNTNYQIGDGSYNNAYVPVLIEL